MTEHDPTYRRCIEVGLPLSMLQDDSPCPACAELSMVADLDPDFGSAEDGRPAVRETSHEH